MLFSTAIVVLPIAVKEKTLAQATLSFRLLLQRL
jgi:hypothetical protein